MSTNTTARKSVFEGEALLRTVATAIVRLSKRRQPGDPVYDDVTQKALNQLVLLCLRRGFDPPGSVPEMISWARWRPLAQWPLDLDPATFTDRQVLVDPQTHTPTQFCLEWALSVADPTAEQFENQLLHDALATCRVAQSPQSYTELRRLLIERPVLTAAEQAELTSNVDLLPVLEIVGRSYDPAPASYLHDGAFHTCRRCGCLLVPTTDKRLRCELDRCLKEGNAAVGRTLAPQTGGGVRYLQRPLRVFITGPGLAERDLEQELQQLGLAPEMWPNYDSYDLRVKLPDGHIWAIDVKDRANPALLGRTTTLFRSNPPFTKAFLIVPAYRLREREDYERVFRHHLPPELRQQITLHTDRKLLAMVRASLGKSAKGTANA